MRELDVELNGPVHYADFGGQGKPILLIHGLAGSRLNWLSVAPALAEDHRVFALDLIGSPASRRCCSATPPGATSRSSRQPRRRRT